MISDFLTMLNIYKAGLWQISDVDACEITDGVVQLAINQGIFPIFYAGVNVLKKADKVSVSDEVYARIKNTALTVVGKNIRKQQMASVLFSELERNGINFCVLKGETLAVLYPDSTCRISGDIDLLISREDLSKTSDVLEKFGFKVSPLVPASQHLISSHPVIGTVEAHIALYDEHLTEPFFKDYAKLNEAYIKVGDDGINTLGINDGLIFVFFHLVKHLLIEGAGIRQFTDLLIYIKHYKDKIDWDLFENIIKDLKYDTIFDVILTVGIKYLGFSRDDLPKFVEREELICDVFEDIQSGGCFGFSDKNRQNFSNAVIARKQMVNNTSKSELNSWNRKKFWFFVLPPLVHLKKRYGYVRKYPFLYPIGLLHRAVNALIFVPQKIRYVILKHTSIGKLDPSNKKRLKLMSKLKMI